MGLVDYDEQGEQVTTGLVQHGTVFARLPEHVNLAEDITNYGADNLYPNRMEEVSLRSGITLSAMRVHSDFVKGNGFEMNGDVIVNRWGETLNDLLRLVSDSSSLYNGYGLHFNVNPLGLITEINFTKFKNIRYGLPNSVGRHVDVKVSNNWERDLNKTVDKRVEIKEFPMWDMHAQVMDNLHDDIGEFSGFIFYKVPRRDNYPLCTFDSVVDSVQTQGELQVFELSGVQNGFLGATLFKVPGSMESDKEKNQLKKDLFNLTGPHNANSVLIVEDVEEGTQLIEQLAANNNDRLFEITNKTTRDRIVTNYAVPFPLLGIQPDGGMFNQEQLHDSYVYMNARTRDKRNEIVDDFNKFLKFWAGGSIDVGSIIESSFEVTTQQKDEETL
jgi:hypothetical protein